MRGDVASRFWAKVDRGPNCWEWTAAKSDGYGRFSIPNGSMPVAHRVAWELLRGPVPSGMQLDHLCRNRACVNPDHLEPVTCRINVLRGEGNAAANAAKAKCPKGHPYSEANTYVDGRGGRNCSQCNAERCRSYRQRLAMRAAGIDEEEADTEPTLPDGAA